MCDVCKIAHEYECLVNVKKKKTRKDPWPRSPSEQGKIVQWTLIGEFFQIGFDTIGMEHMLAWQQFEFLPENVLIHTDGALIIRVRCVGSNAWQGIQYVGAQCLALHALVEP